MVKLAPLKGQLYPISEKVLMVGNDAMLPALELAESWTRVLVSWSTIFLIDNMTVGGTQL